MPCDTIRNTVAKLKGARMDIVSAALKKMGFSVDMSSGYVSFSGTIRGFSTYGSYDRDTGKLEVQHPDGDIVVDLIKRAYSAAIIEKHAKMKAWALIPNGPNKYTAGKPYSKDKINIEIMKDGVVKTTTDKISMANHRSAESFLLDMSRELGGPVTETHKHGGAVHSHEHGHQH